MSETGFSRPNADRVKLAAKIVAAYVSNHIVSRSDLAGLISTIQNNLLVIAIPDEAVGQKPVKIEKQKPAVSIRKSLRDNSITCLECGGDYKSMKRHLMVFHDLSPEVYRAKWRLSAEYPMVAPAYAEARSILAREIGLGRGRKKSRGGRRD